MKAPRIPTSCRVLVAVLCLTSFRADAQLLNPPYPPSAPPIPPLPRPLPIMVPPLVQLPGETAPPPLGPVLPPVYVPKPVVLPPPIQQAQFPPPNYGPLTALSWDAEQKESTPASGEVYANFSFWFTNTSAQEVTINAVRTSCGCTVARLPATPWLVQPGTNGPIEVSVDLRGKMGTISKSVTVETSAGTKSLIVKLNLPMAGTPPGFPVSGVLPPNHPPMADADRLANMQKSLADRQVVFKDAACAKCHADPAKNVADGATLYRGVCATCHDSLLRAAAVTDLHALKNQTDLDYWKHWITYGKPGSMMPSFGQSAGEGGPLTDPQVAALAAYCLQAFPAIPVTSQPIPFKPTNATASAVSIFPVPPKTN